MAEDISSFIRAMKPRPVMPEEISRRLAVEYGANVPRSVLLDILALIDEDQKSRQAKSSIRASIGANSERTG